MLQKQISYKDALLSYASHGEGKTLMLLHGFGEDSSIWKNQIEALKGYKLIIPDLPGTAASGMIEDMSMEALAESVHAIIKEEGIDSFVLLGHSMGGYITLAYAAAFPRELAGFGLLHSTAYSDSEEKKETRCKGIEFIKKNGAGAFLKTSTPNLYADNTKEANPHLIEQHIALSGRFSSAALIAYYESMIQRPNRTEVLSQASVPVLFVVGRWDAAVPPADGLQQARLPQLSYIHILEQSGHMGMVEEPEKMNAAILEFTEHCFKHRI